MYEVDIKKHSGQTVFEGKESGLMLLIDVNSEKSIDITTHDKDKDDETSVRDVYLGQERTNNKNKDVASIHIGTLARYTGYGPGDYALTVIKQITGTENFLAWPEDKRKCALEKYEKCQMKGFLEKSMKCGCSPFQLLPAKRNQVAIIINFIYHTTFKADLFTYWHGLYSKENFLFLWCGLPRTLC